MGTQLLLFCHLCNYKKTIYRPSGSRYAVQGSNGTSTGTGRSFYKHKAVRYSNAQRETLRLLGMKPYAPEMQLPLHSLRSAIVLAGDRIPRYSNGSKILSSCLDPYQACYIAPNHVLTIHFKDCVNVVFKLLPVAACRSLCEQFMISFLAGCNLKTQNRLLDPEKKSLFSMSLTDLYSLSVVAEFSFLKGCEFFESLHTTAIGQQSVSKRCKDAVSVVGSVSRLIAKLWLLPRLYRDPPSDSVVSALKCRNNAKYANSIQKILERLLFRIRDLCQMSSEDVQALQDSSLPRAMHNELLREQTQCKIAKRSIDKPNVHRLVELVWSTIPMVGRVSQVGELVLEKAHQTLKRAIRHGNNKDLQLLSMSAAIYNDWEWRLSMQAKEAIEGNPIATIGCFRLLAGREAVANANGQLTAMHRDQLLLALGPVACVPTVLESGRRRVISIRSDRTFLKDLSWNFTGNMETVNQPGDIYISSRLHVLGLFQHANRFAGPRPAQKFAEEPKILTKYDTSLLALRVADVVQMVCYRPNQISFHVPFFVNKNSVGEKMDHSEGYALWAVSALFRPAKTDNGDNYWASLWPCIRLPLSDETNEFYRRNYHYFFLSGWVAHESSSSFA